MTTKVPFIVDEDGLMYVRFGESKAIVRAFAGKEGQRPKPIPGDDNAEKPVTGDGGTGKPEDPIWDEVVPLFGTPGGIIGDIDLGEATTGSVEVLVNRTIRLLRDAGEQTGTVLLHQRGAVNLPLAIEVCDTFRQLGSGFDLALMAKRRD
jgi:hypothetical protein